MALDQSALLELLDAMRAGGGLDVVREALIAATAPEKVGSLSRFYDRIAVEVERDPAGSPPSIAAMALPQMSEEQRGRVFAASAGLHASITEAWSRASDEEVAFT